MDKSQNINLTKAQYCKSKNLPSTKPLKRLDPQAPARTHLIDMIRPLAFEVQKWLQASNMQQKMVMEYAQCRKVILTLEEEIKVLKQQSEIFYEQTLNYKNKKINDQRKISDLERQIMALQSSNQKLMFQYKMAVQNQKKEQTSTQQHYEKQMHQAEKTINHYKNLLNIEISKMTQNHTQERQRISNESRETFQANKAVIEHLKSEIQKLNQQNIHLKKQIYTNEEEHLRNIKGLQSQYLQMKQLIIKTKAQLEHTILMKNNHISHLELTISEKESQIQTFGKKLDQNRKVWLQEKQEMEKSKMQLEKSWRNNYQIVAKINQQTNQKFNQMAINLRQASNKYYSLDENSKELQSRLKQTQFSLLKIRQQNSNNQRSLLQKNKTIESLNQKLFQYDQIIIELQEKLKEKATERKKELEISYQTNMKILERQLAFNIDRFKIKESEMLGQIKTLKQNSETLRRKKLDYEGQAQRYKEMYQTIFYQINNYKNIADKLEREASKTTQRHQKQIQVIQKNHMKQIQQIQKNRQNELKGFKEKALTSFQKVVRQNERLREQLKESKQTLTKITMKYQERTTESKKQLETMTQRYNFCLEKMNEYKRKWIIIFQNAGLYDQEICKGEQQIARFEKTTKKNKIQIENESFYNKKETLELFIQKENSSHSFHQGNYSDFQLSESMFNFKMNLNQNSQISSLLSENRQQ